MVFLLVLTLVASQSFEHSVVVRVSQNLDSLASYCEERQLDVWSARREGWDVHVARDEAVVLQTKFNGTIIITNVQELVDAELEGGDDWFTAYHPYEDIMSWYQALADAHDFVSMVSDIGQGHDGNSLAAVHFFPPAEGETKDKLWIQALIHSREWITGATVCYIAEQLTQLAEDDPLRSLEIIIIPVVNPDGYRFTWESNRMWRKNRLNSGNGAMGVDLNRNWNSNWGGVGSSPDPHSETYRGPAVQSEPEVQALVAYFDGLASTGRVLGALDVHSFGQLVLWPFAYTVEETPVGIEHIAAAGNLFAETAGEVHGSRYTPGPWFTALYPSSGVSQDWFNGDAVPSAGRRAYGYTIELRPASSNPGFLLPPQEIIPTGEEIWPAVVAWANYVQANPLPLS